jgi:hypothetical protein
LNRLDEWLTREVKFFAMTHISNSLGRSNPIIELCARARKLGVPRWSMRLKARASPRRCAGNWLRFPGVLGS